MADLSKFRQLFHLYSVLAIVVFVIICVIARGYNDNVHAWARLPSWMGNSFVLGCVTFLALFLSGFATSMVSIKATPTSTDGTGYKGMSKKVSGGSLFVITGVLLVLAAILVYRTYNFWFAFYVTLLALVLSIFHFASLFSSHRALSYMSVPLVLLLATFVYYLWTMGENSIDLENGFFEVSGVEYKA